MDLLDQQDEVNVVLTGGTVGTAVLSAINTSPARDSIDWSRVNIWWGDERWLPAETPNATTPSRAPRCSTTWASTRPECIHGSRHRMTV